MAGRHQRDPTHDIELGVLHGQSIKFSTPRYERLWVNILGVSMEHVPIIVSTYESLT